MRRFIALGAVLALALAVAVAALAGTRDSQRPLTFAVYGDAPYGTSNTDTAEFDATPAFIQAVNADPAVSEVVHVGDIHSGSQRCTQAYDQSVYDLWTKFRDPLIYTPGDNEWSDCQKTKELAGDPSLSYANGNPAANLALVRQIFFAHPGRTLGGRMDVDTQAQAYDRSSPNDAKYVENVMWKQDRVLFVTVNLPGGSNDDADPWFGVTPATDAQKQEQAQRTQADLDWLDRAFQQAQPHDVSAVVIFTQADMWDTADLASHQTNYEPFISSIAHHTLQFGGPVLLFNGDSHLYRSDDPLVQGAPCVGEATSGAPVAPCAADAWNQHPNPAYNAPNFHRVVVHGSTMPLEYLRLTINPNGSNPTTDHSFGPFSWTRVQP